MKILLMGNPNVGKSVVFNRLTGARVITSNYPGTTVEYHKGYMRIEGKRVEVIDVPGTYSLDPSCKAEEIACRMLDKSPDQVVVINVVDATNLERSLNLTLSMLGRRVPMIVALNLWDEAGHIGVHIDVQRLEKILGVPCVPVVAVTGEGIKNLVDRLGEATESGYAYEEDKKWQEIGRIVGEVQRISHRHHTFRERLADASVKPFPGVIIAAGVLLAAFEIIRVIGEGLIGYVGEPVFEKFWAPIMLKLSSALGGQGFVHDVLVGRLVEGHVDFGESFGVLTTGLFVPFVAVLPYVFAFYLVLSFLEDSGYLPRLAILTDSIMHHLGLHGMAIIPMLLGLGCNVPGALSTRIMESRKERFIAGTLMAVCIPCMAQISMIVGLAGKYGALSLLPVFGTLFVVWILLGVILGRLVRGESPEILMDVPPYRLPYLAGFLKKTWMRVFWFLREAIPWVLFGVLLVNILHSVGIIQFVGRVTAPVITDVLGLPEEAAGGLVVGFLRKDVAVGMLAPLHLSLKQLIVACVVLAMYFPCVATFAVMLKELGIFDMLKSALVMVLSAIIVGGFLNLVL
jgi:ferrous iron transport protein B